MLDKEQEWLSSLIKESTKLHHAKAFLYLKEFFNKTPEEILELRKKEGKRFNTRIVLFWKWLQEDKGLGRNTASSYCIGRCECANIGEPSDFVQTGRLAD
jgi:hypothetical protein